MKSIHPADVIKDIKPLDLKGLKVVFINMPLRQSVRPTATAEGILLMATNLRQNYSVEASVIDLNAYRIKDKLADSRNLPQGRHLMPEEAKELIREHFRVYGYPDMVGLSGIITTLRWQEIVARIVRETAPDTFLVSGNGLATELKMGLFNYIPELDAAAHSEGDDIILKICLDAKVIKQLGRQQAADSGKLVPYYLGKIDGRHRFLYEGDRPRDLNKLPFANLDLLAVDVYGNPIRDWLLNVPGFSSNSGTSSAVPWEDADLIPKTTSVSSRGCPFKCNYCYRGQQGERNWGTRSANHLYQELLAHLEKYRIKFKIYPDDNFAVTVRRIEEMVPLLGPLHVPWGTHTRMDEGADIRRIKLMSEAGCAYIGFGPESANPETLTTIGKGGHTLSLGMETVSVNSTVYHFPRSMTTALRNCLNYGIHANCTWIVGSPTETLERLKDTVAFMAWQEKLYGQHGIPATAVNKRMFTMTWYPGTEMIKYAKVRQELTRVFDLTFLPSNNIVSPFEPVCNENFHHYLLELDDATKLLENQSGQPLNFSEIPNNTFVAIRELIDSGQIFKILEM